MFKHWYRGITIEVPLPNTKEHKGYSVECTYRFLKSEQKYKVTMVLINKNNDGKYKISGENVDSQLIASDRENIEENITRIVEQAYNTGFFEPYIYGFEYTALCFYKGDEIYSEENPDGGDEYV